MGGQIAPKEDELASLQAFQGDRSLLTPPEQFLVMMSEIPRLANKLNLLRNLHQFEVSMRLYARNCWCAPGGSFF